MTNQGSFSIELCRPPTEGFPPPPRIPTCAGHSPPSVLGGIQLSGLPWSPAGVSSTTFGLAPRGSAVSSRSPPTSRSPHHRMMGRVSFLFWSRPSQAASLDAARPAAREELPQEIPVARPPARVANLIFLDQLTVSRDASACNSYSRVQNGRTKLAHEGITFTANKTTLGFLAGVVVVALTLGAFTMAMPSSGGRSATSTSPFTTNHNGTISTTSTFNSSLYGYMYLTADSGCYSSPGPAGPWSPSPCLGPRSDAVVFNCLGAAATSQGCTQRFYFKGNPNASFAATVWFPFYNSTASSGGYNCRLNLFSHYSYEDCMTINSTAFIVGQPRPPPP